MAMGFRPQRKGLFGTQTPMTAPNGTPPIRDPQQDMGSPMGMPGLGMAQQPTAEKKAGFFGEGGAGRMIAGSIGDMLLHNAGMAPLYFPMIQRQREQAAEAAAAQRKRAEDFADWQTKERWKLDNQNPAIQQNYEFIRQTAGEEAANRYVTQYGQQPEEPRMVSIPGRGSFFGTMSEVREWLQGNEPSNVPERPVGGLTPMGGGAGNSVGGFR